jgi:fructose PTS system EIIBC or EIIC component
MPVVVIPLISTLVVGALMLVLGQPIAAASRVLTSWLNDLSGANAVVLGVLLGLMMASTWAGRSTRSPTPSGWPGWPAATTR